MKRLLAVLFAVAVALPVAADTQVVCSISAQAETACSAITVSQAGQFDQCRCNQNAPAPAGPFGGHATLADGLVSYWPLSEESGQRNDIVGTNHLTDNNTVGYANMGPQGVVPLFVIANSEFLSNATISIAADSDVTVAGWVRFDNVAGAQTVFFGGSAASDAGTNFILWNGAANNFTLYTRGFNDSVSTAAGAEPNQWRFVVARFRGSDNTLGISLDGGAETTAAGAGNNGAITQLRIGARHSGNYTGGNIARLGVWNSVLDSTAITSLYNSGLGKAYSDLTTAEKAGLVSYWNLDEASGNRADSHGSNTLTDNNTVTSVDNTHPGFGKAASFVAANSESLTRAAVSLPSDYTIGFWYKGDGTRPDGFETPFCALTTWNTQTQFFGYFSNGVMTFGAGRDGVAAVSTNLNYQDVDGTLWHFVIFSYDSGTEVLTGYIDNDAGTSTAALGGARYAGPSTLAFGFFTGVGTYFPGSIGEAFLYDRVLTAQERTDLYAAGAGLFYED